MRLRPALAATAALAVMAATAAAADAPPPSAAPAAHAPAATTVTRTASPEAERPGAEGERPGTPSGPGAVSGPGAEAQRSGALSGPGMAAVRVLLDAQADALLRGDESAWLAPVGAALHDRYRFVFRSLRALGVSHFRYAPRLLAADDRELTVAADAAYCFGDPACPADPPHAAQKLTLTASHGRWQITAVGFGTGRLQPPPWAYTELVVERGHRVTVAAPRSAARHLPRVRAVAERAAEINDRFAGYAGTAPPNRYRIYLADEKAWRTWYAGRSGRWAVAYTLRLNAGGSDVVLRADALTGDDRLLTTTIKHELGHVVTVGDVTERNRNDRWLTEGVAEWIGWYPAPVTASWRRDSVRELFRDDPPASIAAAPPGSGATRAESGRFYGFGHFAVACLADTYGPERMFTFLRLHVREGRGYDAASRAAFGAPFARVDHACLTWIRDRL